MIIDKKSKLWEKAPWHVNISAYGSKTVKGIAFWMHFSWIIGLLSFVLMPIAIRYQYYEYADILFLTTAVALAVYPYALALIWIYKYPEVLVKTKSS